MSTATQMTGNMTAREQIKEAMERYVDAASVESVLDILGEICSEKAQHIQDHWGDSLLARSWDKAAQFCFRAAANKAVKVLP